MRVLTGPVDSSLSSLHRRLRLPRSLRLDVLKTCLTDSSINTDRTNEGLARLGYKLLQYHVSSRVTGQLPRLPLRAARNAIDGYAGNRTLASVCRGWGVQVAGAGETVESGRLVHGRVPSRYLMTDETIGLRYHDDACADFVRAVAAAVHTFGGAAAGRRFVEGHILARNFEHASAFRITSPQRHLSHLLRREGLDSPTTRMLAETGRNSNSPSFLTAVFSGEEKVSEGSGTSLREAEHDVCDLVFLDDA